MDRKLSELIEKSEQSCCYLQDKVMHDTASIYKINSGTKVKGSIIFYFRTPQSATTSVLMFEWCNLGSWKITELILDLNIS